MKLHPVNEISQNAASINHQITQALRAHADLCASVISQHQLAYECLKDTTTQSADFWTWWGVYCSTRQIMESHNMGNMVLTLTDTMLKLAKDLSD